MSGSTQSKANKRLRLVSLGMTIALFVLILIPAGQGLASPRESQHLQVAAPSFSKEFLPSTIGPGSVSTLLFSIGNDTFEPVTDLAFVDLLPGGVSIATPANAFTDCAEATLTAPDGGDTIAFSGGRLGEGSACIISVDVTSSTPGTHQNVSGDLTSSAGNSGPATADLTVATDRPGFSKNFAPSTVSFSGRSTLTFTVDNTANPNLAAGLTFADILPIGMVVADPANSSTTCTSGIVAAIPGSSLIAFSDGFVTQGASCTVSADVTATATADNVSGELISTPPTGGPGVISGKASARLEVTLEDLQLVKSFADDPIPPGATATLAFTINNRDRSQSATNLTFSDDLGATLSGLIAVAPLPTNPCGPGSTLSGTNLLTLAGGNLSPEGSCTFSVTLQIPAGALPGAYPNTTSSITGDVGGSPVSGSPASDILFVKPAPALTKEFRDAVTLTPDPVVGAGEDVVIRFTVQNTSLTSFATDIAFIDELTTFLPIPVSVVLPGDNYCGSGSSMALIYLGTDRYGLSMTGGSLAPGASCTFDVTLSIPVGFPNGIYTNTTEDITATVDGENVIGRPASDDLVVVAAPMLSKEFTDDPVSPGGTVTLEFTLSYDELAPSDAISITFTDDLGATLAGLEAIGLPVNDVCGTGSQLTGTSMLNFTGGSLAPGETCTFSVSLQVPAGALVGSYGNTTSNVTATILGATATENPASDDLRITGLIFTKEFIGDPVIPGDTVTLRFTLDNSSSTDDATGIFFTDNLDGVLSGLAAVGLPLGNLCGSGSQISGTSSLVFNGGIVPAGTSCTFDITLQVPATAAPGTYYNATSILFATVGGNGVTLDPATDVLTVQSDWLWFNKTFLDDPVRPGDNVSLEFTITNTHGSGNATSITFTDDLDATLSGLVALGLPVNDVCGMGSQLSGTSLLTLTGGNLAPGASCTFSVSLQVPMDTSVGDYTNTTSQITGTINDLGVIGEPASDNLRIDYLTLSKSFESSVLAGNTVTLTFTIENHDATTGADGLAFTDDLDAVVSGLVAAGLPVTDVCGAGSQVAGTSFITFNGGNLLPGGSCTFDIVLQVPAAATSGIFPNTTSDLFSFGLPVGVPANAPLIVDPTPIVSIDDVFVNEGAGTAAFTVALDAVSFWDVAVDYVTLDGTALAGLDYTADAGTVLIPAGDITNTLNIPILEDTLDENSETFTVTLSGPVNATIADGEGLGTITDNDAPPTLSIEDISVNEGAGTATFIVTLSTFSGLDVTVDYTTNDGTALAGLDYTSLPTTTLNLPAGTISSTVTVTILEDTLDENSETFTVRLSSPVNATIADGEGLGTITDNDAPPTLSIEDVSVNEGVGTATVTVTLSTVSGLDVTVNYETSDDTAQVGLDYMAVSGTLTISGGETQASFDVIILEDASYEPAETVLMELSAPVNASVSGSLGILTILDNDFGLFLPIVFNNHVGDQLIYENDFEGEAGDEWSDQIVDIAPNGEHYLGQFASDTITLTLVDLPEHSQVRIAFDLYVIRSWDGNNQINGPDIWALTLDGDPMLQTTFSNWDADNQAYPGNYPGGNYPARTGATANNTLGYFWHGYPQDATYHFTFVIDHTDSDLQAVFSSGLFALGDESWGLDNVEVVLLP